MILTLLGKACVIAAAPVSCALLLATPRTRGDGAPGAAVERIHAQFSCHVGARSRHVGAGVALGQGEHTAGFRTVGNDLVQVIRVGSTLTHAIRGRRTDRSRHTAPQEQAREAGQAVKSREVVITAVFLSNVLFFLCWHSAL